MEKKQWKNLPDFLVVGIETIDEQHDEFVGLLNKLSILEICRQNKDDLQDLINQLKEYSSRHFEDEVKLMYECEYPGIEQHQEFHQIFKEKLAEFEKGLSYKNLMIDAQLKTFLSRWALNHIGEHDLKFGEYYRSKA